ncbi:MAG: PAS domain-containing protein [Hyphomicrobiales bacterium]|nr:PAS domain-containing protein [Hyphomicrobiales bacterium]
MSYILRLATAEAYNSTADDDAFELPQVRKPAARELIAGIWDWDIRNDRNHLDADAANFFGVDPVSAARGLPNSAYLNAVHPDDQSRLQAAVKSAMRLGGAFECEYRVIKADRVHWVLARGNCTLDRRGRPVRLPGALIDITHDKAMN